ncbi:MAG: FAD:protein FMN transferase [Planctomycetaceae bacterium]
MERSLLSVVGYLLLSLAAHATAADPVTLFGPTMGTAWSVKLASLPDEVDPESIRREIVAYLDQFDILVSTYRDDSELSRFNALRETDWFDVSLETAQLLQRTTEIAREARGAFDPTVAPLTKLWRFDRHEGRTALPSEAEIQSALGRVGFEQLAVRLEPPGLKKARPDLELNLNAVAPGWAVDRIVELLEKRGLANYLVDVGSEIRTGGRKSDGSAWQVGIERPADEGHVLQASLPLKDRAIATSGDYRNFYVVDGTRYSHTIDPRTGRPVQHGLASVTVISDDCTTADALATAMSVLGPKEGLSWANEHQIAVWMMVRDPSGTLRIVASDPFTTHFASLLVDLAGNLSGDHQSLPGAKSAAETPLSSTPPGQHEASAPAESSPWLLMLITLGVFLVAAAGLAIGLVFRGKPLAGSCGGLAGMKDEHGRSMCGSCTIPPEQCDEFRKSQHQATVNTDRNSNT